MAVFLEPYDTYLVPAEAIWNPQNDTFHSIFSEAAWNLDEWIQENLAHHARGLSDS